MYNINGDSTNISPLPVGYIYSTLEAAIAARNGSSTTTSSGTSSITSTPARASAAAQVAISIRISGFLTPA